MKRKQVNGPAEKKFCSQLPESFRIPQLDVTGARLVICALVFY